MSREIPPSKMTKEEILEGLKKLIRATIHDKERLRTDIGFSQEWVNTQRIIGIEARRLNPDDTVWLNKEYMAWVRSELQPYIDKLDPETKALAPKGTVI